MIIYIYIYIYIFTYLVNGKGNNGKVKLQRSRLWQLDYSRRMACKRETGGSIFLWSTFPACLPAYLPACINTINKNNYQNVQYHWVKYNNWKNKIMLNPKIEEYVDHRSQR